MFYKKLNLDEALKTSVHQEIDELERELKLRELKYPEWVGMGKINKQLAEQRIKTLRNAIKRLQATIPTQCNLFK